MYVTSICGSCLINIYRIDRKKAAEMQKTCYVFRLLYKKNNFDPSLSDQQAINVIY
jgi:hypothetical protein